MNEPFRSFVVIVGVLGTVLTVSAGLIWLERRLLALWQDRYGPNRVGPFGLFQVLADMIKIFTKEDWIPPFADKPVFVIAPAVVVVTGLMSFAVIPFAPGIWVVDLNIGILFFLAMSSLGAYSVVLAGWASNSKYALLGGLRASAQMLSYDGGGDACRIVHDPGDRGSPAAHVVLHSAGAWPFRLYHRGDRRDAPAPL